MITVDEALRLIDERASPLPPVRVSLREALGKVLACDVASDIDSPPYTKAMMDGFAVVLGDRSVERMIEEEIMAGEVPHHAIVPGKVTRVMTGAPIPDGAGAVVPVEKTEMVDAQTVRIGWLDPPAGKHLMPQGSSMKMGQQVIARGTKLRAIEIAILAEIGCSVVDVSPLPRVALLATGNELTPVACRPGPGQIRNSGGPMLAAAVTQAGATPVELPVGQDDTEELSQLVTQGLEADLLLVTGGVSAGVKDLVPEALARTGVEQVFHKVALKPGKPIWFGVAPSSDTSGPPKLVFGLPGNPVSGLVCFYLFVKPLIDRLAGRVSSVGLQLTRGRMAEAHQHQGGRETFRPARCLPTSGVPAIGSPPELPRIEITPWKGSADLAGLATVNCLLRLPTESVELLPGQEVEFLPLH